ncbi:hypothetical protein TNCV_3554091 [Trichonephila clavipes]|nr:hypothetical protein TNCV_3554091 [Trichonephila clavipes]
MSVCCDKDILSVGNQWSWDEECSGQIRYARQSDIILSGKEARPGCFKESTRKLTRIFCIIFGNSFSSSNTRDRCCGHTPRTKKVICNDFLKTKWRSLWSSRSCDLIGASVWGWRDFRTRETIASRSANITPNLNFSPAKDYENWYY